MKQGLIDANALMEYCLNQKEKTIDCNDIARFPTVLTLPENATNGDMIKAMFPNCEVCTHEFVGLKCGVDVKFYLCENVYFTVWFTTDWWNTPYKGVSK